MPHTLDDINALFAQLRAEWDTSEVLVKAAEQVCGDAIIPSIKEFRYAGRRLVDAFNELAVEGDTVKANAFVQDAIFNCHCARHDAIDVATGIMAATLDVAVQRIGYEHITKAYPKFAEFRRRLSDARAKIRGARGDRANRDAIYMAVKDADFPTLITMFEDYQSSEDMMRSLARRARWSVAGLVVSLICNVVLAAVAVAALLKPEHTTISLPPGATITVPAASSASATVHITKTERKPSS